jgi:hypothetical protein
MTTSLGGWRYRRGCRHPGAGRAPWTWAWSSCFAADRTCFWEGRYGEQPVDWAGLAKELQSGREAGEAGEAGEA